VKITPLSAVGAEVTEVDVTVLTAVQDAQLKAAFAQHGLLIFRDQDLTEADHIGLAERWARLIPIDFLKPMRITHKSRWLIKPRIKFRTSAVIGIPITPTIRCQPSARSWSRGRCRKPAEIRGLPACTAPLINYPRV